MACLISTKLSSVVFAFCTFLTRKGLLDKFSCKY